MLPVETPRLRCAECPGVPNRRATTTTCSAGGTTSSLRTTNAPSSGWSSEGTSTRSGRASRLDQGAVEVGEAGRNPTTGVYRLTELIRSA
jgi:hypothetical protein